MMTPKNSRAKWVGKAGLSSGPGGQGRQSSAGGGGGASGTAAGVFGDSVSLMKPPEFCSQNLLGTIRQKGQFAKRGNEAVRRTSGVLKKGSVNFSFPSSSLGTPLSGKPPVCHR